MGHTQQSVLPSPAVFRAHKAARMCVCTHTHTRTSDDMASPFTYIWLYCRLYPAPQPVVQYTDAHTCACARVHTTQTHTNSCILTSINILIRTPSQHGFSCFYIDEALLLVLIGLLPHHFTHVHTHRHTHHIQPGPKGGPYYCLLRTSYKPMSVLYLQPPRLTHTKSDTQTCTQSSLLPAWLFLLFHALCLAASLPSHPSSEDRQPELPRTSMMGLITYASGGTLLG